MFRVLKFLNQNCHSGEINIDLDDNPSGTILTLRRLYKTTYPRLYGYKPRIPSYRLRLIFLHILQGVCGTKAEEELTDGRLLMCLMDMLKHVDDETSFMIHPFIVGNALGFTSFYNSYEKLSEILTKMRSVDGKFSLLNY